MGKVIWSKLADDSLLEIWEFYAEKSISAADKVMDEIIETTEHIHFPEQYQTEEILEKDYRRAIVRHFKIIYRIERNNIRILDVFYTRKDPEKMGK